ncbi:MAG TPA: protoporphyrinogen oxidase [Methylomirabilota bacterium]|nr:protoporphyrinogen oxidase [Methylomirabilota bacterium]
MSLAVVGGGVAGLAAAHRAVEWSRERSRPIELTVLEATDRLGGTIQTERREGFLVECGPDSFLSEKPWALALCRRLGIEDRLVRTDDRYRQTYVVFRGRLHPLPEGFQLLAPTRLRPFVASRLFSWPGKLRMALDLVLPRGGDPDESLGAFVRRRLGREALERVAQPLVAGIYTADPDELSLAATMPRFLELERKERSLILALWRAARRAPAQQAATSGARWSLFVTFADGMEELIRALAQRLPPEAVRLKEPVTGIARDDGRWRLATAAGAAHLADAVVLAPEAHQVARMVRYLDPSLAHLLEGIAYASSATVTFAYRRADIAHPLAGFGFVVPQIERRPIIACTFSSVKYPGRAPAGHVLLRVFMGGALNEDVLRGDDETLAAVARSQLVELLGARGEPLFTRVSRYVKAMPQYHVGHLARVGAIEDVLRHHRGLVLAGGAYRGVGIADCIHWAEEGTVKALEGT